ncbi:MAG: DUF151 domain-containing protein [Spirochaetia bacterium]|nr:DUF151 domain-containing protein [Spirochaetia bacterium]
MLEVEIVEVSVTQMGFAIMLKTPNKSGVVPIFIGPLETYSISAALEGQKTERPLTHDLIKNLLEVLRVKIDKIVINDFKGGTFYARLHLFIQKEGGQSEVIDIDTRPSDGIAIALRFKAPIFMEEYVYEQTSVDISLIKDKKITKEDDMITVGDEQLEESADAQADELIESMLETLKEKETLFKTEGKADDIFKSKKEVLEQMLKVAISKERYEEAANIRDEIKNLRKSEKSENESNLRGQDKKSKGSSKN